MHFGDNSVRRNEQQKREREERYARRTRQRTTGEEENRNASEPPAVGSHTTKPIHQRSQSEGGGNDRTYKEDKDRNEDNSLHGESEDEDDLIIGTPLGTYVLRTKGTSENTGTHTPVSGAQDKGKTPQGNTTKEDLFTQRNWEELKRNFENQFSYEDSGFSGGSTQNNTDQEVKKPISQEEFDELRRKFEERLRQFQNLGNNPGVSPPPANNNNVPSFGNNPSNPANMAAQPRRTKVPLPTYKGKTDPDTYMQEFNNVCLANQEDTDAIKLQLFPVTLKKRALEWYSQFGPHHFPDWPSLGAAFLMRFRSKKSEGEVIESLGSLKQKKDETVEEFYERVMVESSKINPQPSNQFKKAWFLNGLKKEYAKHIDLMPTDDLDEAKASARKLELGQMRKGRFLDESDSDDSSDDSEEERKKKKRKSKGKRNDSTKDDIKTLREEIEGLALGSRKFRTGIICRRCRNEGHYVQECQMKQCTNCNSLTHNTSECVYERHESRRPRDRRYGVNQVQPQTNRRPGAITPRREMNERRVRFEPRMEYRREERSPYREGDYRREAGGPYRGNEYRRDDRPYYRPNDSYKDDFRREGYFPYKTQDFRREDGYPYRGGPRGPINHDRYEYTRSLMDNNNTKAAPRTGFTGGPQRDGNPDECFYCHQKGHRKPDCPHFIKHQQELSGFRNTKPAVGANVVSPAVCVMTRAQRAAAEEGKEDSESDDSDDEDDSSSGSSEEQEDHQQRDDNSDEEREVVREQDAHLDEDKDIEERPIGANSEEWKADREVHREVSKTIQEIQEEEGEALPTPEEFAPWYPEKKRQRSPQNGAPRKEASQQLPRQG